ncbi:Uncharacterised protein [Streptococcus agalactiae]|uniref:hypothetical protein n=1 Tax=Streptococcus agalactiae TaxID=1311 RepID=UPI0005E9AE0F|nr:Uncharacterised protein [Streptococcus agalactiae]
MEFNAESSTVFGGLTEVQDAVSAGLNYVSEGFGNFNGTFDTSGKGLEWTKTIKTGMEVRKEAKAGFKVFGLNIDASAATHIKNNTIVQF